MDHRAQTGPLGGPRFASVRAAAMVAVCSLASTACSQRPARLRSTPSPGPSPPAGGRQLVDRPRIVDEVVDRGSFALVHRGRVVGVERFEIHARGRGVRRIATWSRMMLDGRPFFRSDVLLVDRNWRPLRYRGTGAAAGESFAVSLAPTADDDLLQVSRTNRGAVTTRAKSSVDLYLASNGVAHLTGLCRTADRPTDLIAFPDLPLRAGAVANLRIADPDDDTVVALTQIRITVGGASIHLFCSGPRLLLVAAPATRFAAARRELFELLGAIPAPGGDAGEPTGQSPR